MGARIQAGEPVPDKLGELEVLDGAANRHRLGALLDRRRTLLLFVRHFGCIGCAQQIARLAPRLVELRQLDVAVVIVGCGDPDHIDDFVDRYQLDREGVRVVTDPGLAVHDVAGLQRSVWSAYSPRSLYEALRARGRGHRGYGRRGPETQQGGALLVDDSGVVRYVKRSGHLGDAVDIGDVIDVALALFARPDPRAGLI